MIEPWVRPGKEAVLQTSYTGKLKALKREQVKFRPAFGRVESGISRTRTFGFYTQDGRDARTYEKFELSLTAVQDLISDVSNSRQANRQILSTQKAASPADESTGFTLNRSNRETHTSHINTGKKRGRERFRSIPPQTQAENTPAQEIARKFKLCLVRNTGRADGTLTIQEMNGWLEKQIADITGNSQAKGEAIRAMVNYLSGESDNREGIEGGRAASRQPTKKMKGQTVGIEGKSYPVSTLKPDGITTVKLTGKKLGRVRITYTTVGDCRIILGIFTDRDKYDRTHS